MRRIDVGTLVCLELIVFDDWGYQMIIEIITAVAALALIFWGYAVWKAKRERDAYHETASRERKEWLASPQVQRMLSSGPDDAVGKQVFDWLQMYRGKSVQVKYETEDVGEPLSVKWTEIWVVPAPDISRGTRGPELHWELPRASLRLPPLTYHDVSIGQRQMVYTLGFTYAWDDRGIAQGLSPAQARSEVENRKIWTFTL
jgi:hypothetical protein